MAQILCVGGGPTEMASVAVSSFSILGQVVADLVELALADAGERQREEHQQHVLPAAEVAEGDRLAVLVLEREIGCLGAGVEH